MKTSFGRASVLHTGLADVLHLNGRGNYGLVYDVSLPAIRCLLLLHCDTGTGISTQVSGSIY